MRRTPFQEDYLSIDKIEDMYSGMKDILGYIVKDLINNSKCNEAKGVFLRNKLESYVSE